LKRSSTSFIMVFILSYFTLPMSLEQAKIVYWTGKFRHEISI